MSVNVFYHPINFGAIPVVKTGGKVLKGLVFSFADLIVKFGLGFKILIPQLQSGDSVTGDLRGKVLVGVVQEL